MSFFCSEEREQQCEQEQTRQGTDSKSRAAVRAIAKAAAGPTDVDVAAEGVTPWRKWLATLPWMEPRRVGSGPSAGSTVRSNQEENATISVQPIWWRRLGRSFIRGNGDYDALPVVQVKTAVWEWRWRERRREHRGSSLEGEDVVDEPAR